MNHETYESRNFQVDTTDNLVHIIIFDQPEFRNITSPPEKKEIGDNFGVVGEDTGKKKLVKKLQMQHIQTLQLKQKKCDVSECERICECKR
jgi:hypothetical protein